MIAATIRASLTEQDAAQAVQLLAAGDAAEAARLAGAARAAGPDVLWDDPRLLDALLESRRISEPSARLLLYVALRRALLERGLDRRDLADYCASLVLAFGAHDRAYRISEHDENTYAYVVDLAQATERADGSRQFQVLAHLGNFALWLTGLFPDYIAARRARKGGPDLEYYEAAGRSGFQRAAEHRLAGHYGMADLLGEAGAFFTEIRIAMNRFSDRVLFPNVTSPDRLLRQVADQFRTLH